jgi:dipeptidyl aminopeptidase/acylaminoacyl peptidase
LSSDGQRVLVEYENAQTAPEIVAIDMSTNEKKIVARLDPQMDDFLLPKSEVVTWTTSAGYTAKGLLLLPPDYDPNRRYPIVIENGSLLYHGQFVCDSGTDHVASWPRGILADDGILYLTRFWPGINDWESNYYPKGLPGSLAEVAFKQDLIESAVKMLDERGSIDPMKVGLAGFSRGGWYVEYALAHSKLQFAAASATDNVQYSVGEYWLRHNDLTVRGAEGIYGGPPYGDSLKNWLDYSISFNLNRIHTPLLSEVNGYGQGDGDASHYPDNLIAHEEVLVGLDKLHKPVEMYYYPNEIHQPDHPQARIASLHRNVDWFRFWLQDFETTKSESADQYERWELMRSPASARQSSDGGRNH